MFESRRPRTEKKVEFQTENFKTVTRLVQTRSRPGPDQDQHQSKFVIHKQRKLLCGLISPVTNGGINTFRSLMCLHMRFLRNSDGIVCHHFPSRNRNISSVLFGQQLFSKEKGHGEESHNESTSVLDEVLTTDSK